MATMPAAFARRPFRRKRFAPTAAGLVAMQAAMAALQGDAQPVSSDEAMALREQLRLEDELRARRQGELRLVAGGRE